MLPPWDPTVTKRDAISGERCLGCKGDIGWPHADPDCYMLMFRVVDRHQFIARAHLRATHKLTPARDAEIWLGIRDRLVKEMREAGDYDRAMVVEYAAKFRNEVDRAAKHRGLHVHLDNNWDGNGVAPSMVACLSDCMAHIYAGSEYQDIDGYAFAKARLKHV